MALTFDYPAEIGKREFRSKGTLAATQSLGVDDAALIAEIAETVQASKVVSYEITITYTEVDA